VSGNIDVNGDNTVDVIVGAHSANPDGMRSWAGITYVVFGSATLPATIDASSNTFFDGKKGFKLYGEKKDDISGWSVSDAGDVNGDDIGDIIIGANGWDLNIATTDVGRSYVVFGHRGAWPAVVELSSLNGKNGFTISGNLQSENSGNSVSGAGDINNDGFSDIIVGAPYWNNNTGRAVVVYGSFSLPYCKTVNTTTGKCEKCDSGYGLSNDIPGTCVGCVVGTQWNTPPGQGCVNCTLGNECHACDMISGNCTSCPVKMKINGTGCDNCTLGNECLACDMTSGDCTSCPDDRWIDGTGCKTCDAPCVSCNVTSKACTSCPSGKVINGTGCVDQDTESSPQIKVSSSSNDDGDGGGGLSGGAIIAIVVCGGAACLAAVGFIIVFIIVRRGGRRSSRREDNGIQLTGNDVGIEVEHKC
jgi:hypothetical protein